jgi:hypothetical protein
LSRVKHVSAEQIPQSEQLHEKNGHPPFSRFRIRLLRHFLLGGRNWQFAASERASRHNDRALGHWIGPRIHSISRPCQAERRADLMVVGRWSKQVATSLGFEDSRREYRGNPELFQKPLQAFF